MKNIVSKFFKTAFMGTALSILACSPSLSATETLGKVDAGAVFLHIDVLESSRTVKRMDMGAFKADATLVIWKGLCLKPTFMVGSGSGTILTGGSGLGFVIPVNDWLCITPVAGCNWTDLQTTIKTMKVTPIPLPLLDAKEKFRSTSPYLALEATVKFCHNFRVHLQYQYAWSFSHTTIKSKTLPLLGLSTIHAKSHADGANYGLMAEYDVTPCWSVQLGGAYNNSLTKEKHGLRGYGFKLGAAYWF